MKYAERRQQAAIACQICENKCLMEDFTFMFPGGLINASDKKKEMMKMQFCRFLLFKQHYHPCPYLFLWPF